MSQYQISLIDRPRSWQPEGPDDVPSSPGKLLDTLGVAEHVFEAVRQAIAYNEAAQREDTGKWAVVVQPGSLGHIWPGARLCTPLRYKIMAVWWPGGWEPQNPLDVPNCVWRAQGEPDGDSMGYADAVARVRALNRQSMDHAGTMWYVVIALENEPISRTVSYDPAGTQTTVEVRRLHVVRPEEGGGHGDCSHCPAHSFECARENWLSLEQAATTETSRGAES